MNKRYHAMRSPMGNWVVVDDGDGHLTPLEPRWDLHDYCAGDFAWSEHHGGRTLQLALAMLADATGNGQCALHLHEQFAAVLMADCPHEGWQISEHAIRTWVAAHSSVPYGVLEEPWPPPATS